MSQSDLNRAVARATGESVNAIKRMGFSPVCLPIPDRCPSRIRHRRRKRLWARMKRHNAA